MKEIGHSLAGERPVFGHNLVRRRRKIGHGLERERPSMGANAQNSGTNKIWAQCCGRSMKTRAQICKHCTVDNPKTQILYYSGRALCKSGRAQVSSGRARDSKGRVQPLRNMPSCNTEQLTGANSILVSKSIVGSNDHRFSCQTDRSSA